MHLITDTEKEVSGQNVSVFVSRLQDFLLAFEGFRPQDTLLLAQAQDHARDEATPETSSSLFQIALSIFESKNCPDRLSCNFVRESCRNKLQHGILSVCFQSSQQH